MAQRKTAGQGVARTGPSEKDFPDTNGRDRPEADCPPPALWANIGSLRNQGAIQVSFSEEAYVLLHNHILVYSNRVLIRHAAYSRNILCRGIYAIESKKVD